LKAILNELLYDVVLCTHFDITWLNIYWRSWMDGMKRHAITFV